MKSKQALINSFNHPVTPTRPVTVVQARRAPEALYKELKELVYQTFVVLAPRGRALPNVVSDVYNGTIDLNAIAANPARLAQAEMCLKMAWTDTRRLDHYDITDKAIIPVYKTETKCLDDALQAVYGYNPYIAR